MFHHPNPVLHRETSLQTKLQYQIGANYVKVSTESQKQKQKLKIEEVED